MELLKWRFLAKCCLLVSVGMVLTKCQAVSQIASAGTAATTPLSSQEFLCHAGYDPAQCHDDIVQLKKVLEHYPVEGLGPWRWVLVRSRDWHPISRKLGLDPDSPAFTALELRETFLEEALFVHDGERIAELMHKWQRSMPKLLELAVTHELGHAMCGEPNEGVADHFGAELRNGRLTPCRVSRQAKGRAESTEPHGLMQEEPGPRRAGP